MKQFFMTLEDLWVAIAFAEAGEYNMISAFEMRHRKQDAVRMQPV